jgi:hypothetical protein
MGVKIIKVLGFNRNILRFYEIKKQEHHRWNGGHLHLNIYTYGHSYPKPETLGSRNSFARQPLSLN